MKKRFEIKEEAIRPCAARKKLPGKKRLGNAPLTVIPDK